MNLKITINGYTVAFPVDTEVTLNLVNSFFEDRKEDATYPLTLNIRANRHIFGFVERINSENVKREYPAIVYFGAYKLLDGRCVITDINDSEIELFISTDKYSFWGDAKRFYLDEIDLGGEAYMNHDVFIKRFDESLQGKRDFVACHLSGKSGSNTGSGYDENGNYTFKISPNTAELTPFIRLYKLLEKIVSAMGYTLQGNDLLYDEEFKDVLLVCRRNRLYAKDRPSSFEYKNFVPHRTVYEFVTEIEKKFGCTFFVNGGSRTVDIIFPYLSPALIYPEVYDSIEKHMIENDDIVKGVIYKDKEINDELVKPYQPRLKYTWGDSEDAQTIECISTIIGTRDDTWVEDDVQGNPMHMSIKMAATADTTTDKAELDKIINTEIRFSVYRGIVSAPYDGSYNYIDNTLMSPIGFPYTKNQYSLLWDTLFDKYHRNRYQIKQDLVEEHNFYLECKNENLKTVNELFKNTLIIRNRQYKCFEQQITLSANCIKEHIIKCYV